MDVRLPLLAALTLLAGGCGAEADRSTAPEDTNPVASTPAATSPPRDATQPGTGPVTPPPATAPAPATEPGDGGEQAIRVPATFVVRDGRLDPRRITVPPFLAVELSVRSDDGRAHRLVVRAPGTPTLSVPAGGRAALRIAGLRPGGYPLELDGGGAGTLLVGGEAGP